MRWLLALLLATVLVTACRSLPTSPVEQQRLAARRLEPQTVAPPRSSALTTSAPLRVRAYVDETYRNGRVDPEARVRVTVEDAGAILAAQLGVGLLLVDVRPWPGEASDDLYDALDKLERAAPVARVAPGAPDGSTSDDDEPVDIVVGFIGSSPLVTDQLHALGVARVLGHHVVARGINDAQEARAIDAFLSRMPESERSDLVARRRRHKSAMILLHEIAHVLGGVHVDDAASVLFPSYGLEQSRLNEDAVTLLERGLAVHRAVDDDAKAAALAGLREEIEVRRSRLDGPSAAQALALVDQHVSVTKGAVILRSDEARPYNEAIAAWRSGDVQTAWSRAKELARAETAHPRVLALACRLAGADGVVAMEGPALCERAMRAEPKALDAAVANVRLVMRNGRDPGAAFEEALGRVARAPVADVMELASLATAARRWSIVELVLADVDDERARQMLAQASAVRRRVGLPAGAVDDETAFQDAIQGVYAVLTEAPAARGSSLANGSSALKLLDDADARFGEVSGLAAVRCDLLRHERKHRAAEKSCARALELMPDSSFAHVVMGLVHADAGRRARALEHLEKAVELDPGYAPTAAILARLRGERGAP